MRDNALKHLRRWHTTIDERRRADLHPVLNKHLAGGQTTAFFVAAIGVQPTDTRNTSPIEQRVERVRGQSQFLLRLEQRAVDSESPSAFEWRHPHRSHTCRFHLRHIKSGLLRKRESDLIGGFIARRTSIIFTFIIRGSNRRNRTRGVFTGHMALLNPFFGRVIKETWELRIMLSHCWVAHREHLARDKPRGVELAPDAAQEEGKTGTVSPTRFSRRYHGTRPATRPPKQHPPHGARKKTRAQSRVLSPSECRSCQQTTLSDPGWAGVVWRTWKHRSGHLHPNDRTPTRRRPLV